MSLYITSLNSGSNGNCYYIGNDTAAVLVDVGISCREVEKRMRRLNLPIEKLKAIFISHEHGDHISGVTVLSKRYKLPVYITDKTLSHGRLVIEDGLAVCFKAYNPVVVEGLSITAFPKYHDAIEPHSFIVSYDNVNVGIFTDIGVTCEHLIKHFKICHAAFLESNYDTDMLMNGNYPYHLKRRISDGHGHLSNAQALQLFVEHRPTYMSHLILSHLSKNNNTPEIVDAMFTANAGNTKIVVASRYEESELFYITASNMVATAIKTAKKPISKLQLSLF